MAKKAPAKRPSIYKISISLYPADVDRLDELKNFVATRLGIRNIGDSEAIRLAIRVAKIEEKSLAEAYAEMRNLDGRRKKKLEE